MDDDKPFPSKVKAAKFRFCTNTYNLIQLEQAD